MRVILETEKLEAISHRVNNLQEGEIVQWKKRAREIEKLRGQVPRYRSPFPDLSVEQKTGAGQLTLVSADGDYLCLTGNKLRDLLKLLD